MWLVKYRFQLEYVFLYIYVDGVCIGIKHFMRTTSSIPAMLWRKKKKRMEYTVETPKAVVKPSLIKALMFNKSAKSQLLTSISNHENTNLP